MATLTSGQIQQAKEMQRKWVTNKTICKTFNISSDDINRALGKMQDAKEFHRNRKR